MGAQGMRKTIEQFSYIQGQPGHESFNGRMRDELLSGEIFYTLKEAQVVIEHWRNHYNTKRPHSALGYRPPAPEVVLPNEGIREMETDQKAA